MRTDSKKKQETPSNINIENHSLYSKKHQKNLKKALIFESVSFLGRIFLYKEPPKIDTSLRLLNLGCGHRYFKGWINADFFKLKFWEAPKSMWMLDLRYPLNCKSNYWDGIFTEHAIEHLYPNEAQNLFREIYRILKKGHWLRIVVPDLRKYIDYYLGRSNEKEFNKWSTGIEAIRSLTQNWGHHSLWNAQLLKKSLKRAGFININEVRFGEGTEKKLLKDSENRKWESLYMEAKKPVER